MKIQPPQHDLGSPDRHIACRSEIEGAMIRLVRAAVETGWTEAELAMALADASEDLVIEVAGRAHGKP